MSQAITYGGRIHNADGTFAGNFQPLLCHLDGSRLDYTYFGLGANNLARFGVGYVDFWHRQSYVGIFFETPNSIPSPLTVARGYIESVTGFGTMCR